MSQRGVDLLKEFSERHEKDREPFDEWRSRKLGIMKRKVMVCVQGRHIQAPFEIEGTRKELDQFKVELTKKIRDSVQVLFYTEIKHGEARGPQEQRGRHNRNQRGARRNSLHNRDHETAGEVAH